MNNRYTSNPQLLLGPPIRFCFVTDRGLLKKNVLRQSLIEWYRLGTNAIGGCSQSVPFTAWVEIMSINHSLDNRSLDTQIFSPH